MPLMVLACEMCPPEVEATFYSFVLAIINVGYLISYQIGGILTLYLGITDTNFEKLWVLIVVASIYPILNLPFMWCMLPTKDPDEKGQNLIQEESEMKI